MKYRKTVLSLSLILGAVAAFAGGLEPAAPPGPTMKTLDEIAPTWSRILPANDGDPATGCGSSRFDCVLGGAAVLDKETGLVWERSPHSAEALPWKSAIAFCTIASTGKRRGWRLPTVEELSSLLEADEPQVGPPGPPIKIGTLPAGHPFSSVGSIGYWSSTSHPGNTADAWVVLFDYGTIVNVPKNLGQSIWCVRGGQGDKTP